MSTVKGPVLGTKQDQHMPQGNLYQSWHNTLMEEKFHEAWEAVSEARESPKTVDALK
jgi:hypothetical protein